MISKGAFLGVFLSSKVWANGFVTPGPHSEDSHFEYLPDPRAIIAVYSDDIDEELHGDIYYR